MSGLKEKKTDTYVIMYTRERLLYLQQMILSCIKYMPTLRKKKVDYDRFVSPFNMDLIELTIKRAGK